MQQKFEIFFNLLTLTSEKLSTCTGDQTELIAGKKECENSLLGKFFCLKEVTF